MVRARQEESPKFLMPEIAQLWRENADHIFGSLKNRMVYPIARRQPAQELERRNDARSTNPADTKMTEVNYRHPCEVSERSMIGQKLLCEVNCGDTFGTGAKEDCEEFGFGESCRAVLRQLLARTLPCRPLFDGGVIIRGLEHPSLTMVAGFHVSYSLPVIAFRLTSISPTFLMTLPLNCINVRQELTLLESKLILE